MSDAIHHLEDYDTDTRWRATLVSSDRITPEASPEEVRELVFDVDRSDLPYAVGQSVGVLAPGAAAFGGGNHFRLYSVADLPEVGTAGKPRIKIAVRRCSYVDEFSGEEFKGVASNFLCDLRPGDAIQLTGPFGLVFEVPEERDASLVLIGSGTGIAPFRAFVKHIYQHVPDWTGRIWLFYGARSGLELLYMNDERDDFAQYYDRDTFEAFRALSARPGWSEQIAWEEALQGRGDELWELLGRPNTYVYVAGLAKSMEALEALFAGLGGSPERWARRKAELVAGKRWAELVY